MDEQLKIKTVWQLLRAKYPAGECVLLEEVSDTTGGRNRSADFIVVNMWPSRGNSIIGFERKSFRNDWLYELKNPLKQEAIFKYCDFFYLVTDKENIAKIEEIPANWGWMHSDGKRLKTMKDAQKLNPAVCTRQFICSMLRRAADKENYVHKDEIEERIQERAEALKKQELNYNDRGLKDYEILKESVEKFKEASGIDLSYHWIFGAKQTGEAVKLLINGNHKDLPQRLKSFKQSIDRIQAVVEDEIKTFESLTQINGELLTQSP